IAPGAGADRARAGYRSTADRVALLSLSHQQCPVSRPGASPAGAAFSARGRSRDSAGQAGTGAPGGWPAPGGGSATVGCPPDGGRAGVVSATEPEPAAPEAEDAGDAGGLVAGNSSAASRTRRVGRPALG